MIKRWIKWCQWKSLPCSAVDGVAAEDSHRVADQTSIGDHGGHGYQLEDGLPGADILYACRNGALVELQNSEQIKDFSRLQKKLYYTVLYVCMYVCT